MRTVHFTEGPVRSGKTTFARSIGAREVNGTENLGAVATELVNAINNSINDVVVSTLNSNLLMASLVQEIAEYHGLGFEWREFGS